MRKKIWEKYSLDILRRVERGSWIEPLLRARVGGGEIPREAAGFVADVSYGAVRYFYLLSWIAKEIMGDKRWGKLPGGVKWIILLGLYQLKFHSEDKAPFVCYRLVELTKELYHHGLAKLVNAVLRTYLRERISPAEDDLATFYSYPRWLVEDLLELFKDERYVVRLLERGNRRPRIYLRINLRKTREEEFLALLSRKGIRFSKLESLKEAVLLNSSVFPADLPGWKEGLFWLESLCSMLAVKALDLTKGDKVLDLCAGRGVKSADIAQRLNEKGILISVDYYLWKLKELRKLLHRLGYAPHAVVSMDLTVPNPKLSMWASKIMLDVPCSNLADLGGKPEIKLRLSRKSVEELVSLQNKLLEVASCYLKRRGRLVYSTCTFHPLENEGVIKNFLNRHPEYELIPVRGIEKFSDRTTEYGYYMEDGFFALLKRR